jgi:hypothetical protein
MCKKKLVVHMCLLEDTKVAVVYIQGMLNEKLTVKIV